MYLTITKNYQQLDKQIFDQDNTIVVLDDNTKITYTKEYKQLLFDIQGKGTYIIKNYYDESTMGLLEQTSYFHSFMVNTQTKYNVNGEITSQWFRTPDDWVDRLIVVGKELGIDVLDKWQVTIQKKWYKHEKTLVIAYWTKSLANVPISQLEESNLSPEPERKFIFLDYITLKPVISGKFIYQNDMFVNYRIAGIQPYRARIADNGEMIFYDGECDRLFPSEEFKKMSGFERFKYELKKNNNVIYPTDY